MGCEKIILDLCGGTGSWSEPYRKAGYEVITITLPDTNVSDWWLSNDTLFFRRQVAKMDGMTTIQVPIDRIHGILAAPPCTKFSRAAAHIPKKDRDFIGGMKTVRACLDIIWTVQEHGHASLAFWALENPQGYLDQFLGRPHYSFQPWRFGDTSFRATKRTHFWGYFNRPCETVRKRDMKKIPWQSQSGPRKHDNAKKRGVVLQWKGRNAEDRAKTSEKVAEAFFKANP